jgi:DUF1680 family protein
MNKANRCAEVRMDDYSIQQVRIVGGFWADRLRLNRQVAIYHQWDQLEATGCINNFRIAAGMMQGFRAGFFFADSDAYKWLEAAARILADSPDSRLEGLVEGLINIIQKAQRSDGYLFTFNQIHFSGQRWVNLFIEHELYCMGHLIEAGVTHFNSTGRTSLLQTGINAADLMLREFLHADSPFVDGHEEIEIALLRLAKATGNEKYTQLAKVFLERRGQAGNFGWRFLRQSLSAVNRMAKISKEQKAYLRDHPDWNSFTLPERNKHRTPLVTWPRLLASLVSGKFSQQHSPIEKQLEPEGHAVRFSYLQVATAMLARKTNDPLQIFRLKLLWQKMVDSRMYVTGGIGSLPLIEGFGRDYELDPEIAYNETCAAIGSLLWSHEMAVLTRETKYDDLFEWQLYNAASVGIGLDGCSYFYNNPLFSQGGIGRAGWYDVPCCPSNLSRVWASLAERIVSVEDALIRFHHYFTGEVKLMTKQPVCFMIESGLPWDGHVRIRLEMDKPEELHLSLRQAAWSDNYELRINGIPVSQQHIQNPPSLKSAAGLNFSDSKTLILNQLFQPGDVVDLNFGMPIRLLKQDRRLPKCGGMVVVSRGPIVYCLESIDNQNEIFAQSIDSDSLQPEYDPQKLGGVWTIKGTTLKGDSLTWIPYMLWGNRGDSRMTVFTREN